MEIYTAITPIIVAETAIFASFFDGKLIEKKVTDELPSTTLLENPQSTTASEVPPSTTLSEAQKRVISQMACGAATLMMFVANMAIVIAAGVFAIDEAKSETLRRVELAITAISFILLSYHMLHIAVRVKLSDIDERFVWRHLSIGTIMRTELMILNAAVFLELVLSTNSKLAPVMGTCACAQP